MKNNEKKGMTVEELVKSVLNGRDVIVYDRERIRNVVNNALKGFGAANFGKTELTVTYTYGKAGVVKYHISYKLINDSQLTKLKQKFNVEMA